MTGFTAGKFTRQITLLKQGSQVDAYGQPMPGDWVEHAKVWADIRQPTGLGTISMESQTADQQVSRTQYSMRIHFRTDIDAEMRVVDEWGTAYDIRQVLHDLAGQRYTDLVCVAGQED